MDLKEMGSEDISWSWRGLGDVFCYRRVGLVHVTLIALDTKMKSICCSVCVVMFF